MLTVPESVTVPSAFGLAGGTNVAFIRVWICLLNMALTRGALITLNLRFKADRSIRFAVVTI